MESLETDKDLDPQRDGGSLGKIGGVALEPTTKMNGMDKQDKL